MTVLEAMGDATLLGKSFPARGNWLPWRAFLAAVFGLPLDEHALEVYSRHTGRTEPPRGQAREAWVVVGRRGGKSRIAALVAVYLAAFRDYAGVLAPGERGTLPVIAADRRQARTVFRYIQGLIDGCPMLEPLVEGRTAESIDFATGVSIEIHTASWRSLRGYTVCGAVLDEVAVWRSEDSANPDHEIVNALRPAMATVPDALLLAISSPYARRGVLWDAYRKHHGKDGDPVLVWQAPTRAMNPLVPEHVIADAYEQDESAAAAEYGAEFRRDIESFVSREAVEACVVLGRLELPPITGLGYRAFCDPSGGSADSMTLAIAHHEDGKAVLDCVVERKPPFSPEVVVKHFAEVLAASRLTSVTGDRFGGEWVREPFARHGIAYELADKPKSSIYQAFLPLLNSGRAVLLEQPRLIAQLLGLERRTSRAGKDSIDHGPHGKDDVVNSAAGALVAVAEACIGEVLAANLARESKRWAPVDDGMSYQREAELRERMIDEELLFGRPGRLA